MPSTFLFIFLLKRCLIKGMVVPWLISEKGSPLFACIAKSVNPWMYSCKASFATWNLEWIWVAVCTFLATGLNIWQAPFTRSHVDDWDISSINLYIIPSAFACANCISGHWMTLTIILILVIQSKKDLSSLPSYVCKSAKNLSFLYWVYKSENLDVRAFECLCVMCCWLNSSIIDGSILVDPYIFVTFCKFCICCKCGVLNGTFSKVVCHIGSKVIFVSWLHLFFIS